MLEPHEFNIPVIQKLRRELTERLDLLRKKNDKQVSEIETAALRGAIEEVKSLLKEISPKPSPAPKKPANY
jgi:hypothetical protein